MEIKELRAYLGVDWEKTQDCIKSALESDISLLNSTNDSILQFSGKQLRPMLSLLIARACSAGKPLPRDSWRYAAASELLHNATLLHDDVADESDERRGHPTIYKQMGAPVSVLVGDFWLVKAVECILNADTYSAEVIKIFAQTLSKLAEGEMFQLQKAWMGDTDENDYLRIIYNKTATLFETTARAAVIGVGGSKDLCEAMASYARNLGMAFQVRDDIFDYCMDMNVGKPVGADILERKMTLPLLGAFKNAGLKEETEIRALVTDISNHPYGRDEVVNFVKANGGLEYAQMRLDEMISAALAELDVLPESKDKSLLKQLAEYVGNRII